MIEQYEKTAFSDFFNYNDPLINQWAENVYEKIRQLGELAGYAKRDKEVREFFNATDDTDRVPIMVRNNNFTFGYAYSGDALNIKDSRTSNIGRVHKIEFEILFNETSFADVEIFGGYIVMKNSGTITIGAIVFSGFAFVKDTFYRVKIERSNLTVSLYVNDAFIESKLLNTDQDVVFNEIYSSANIV